MAESAYGDNPDRENARLPRLDDQNLEVTLLHGQTRSGRLTLRGRDCFAVQARHSRGPCLSYRQAVAAIRQYGEPDTHWGRSPHTLPPAPRAPA